MNRVDGIMPGLYRFVAGEHRLVPMNAAPGLAEEVARATWDPIIVTGSAVTFIWMAVLPRMYWRYGERGYRYLLLDAGHVCQNLYLAAEAIGCGTCAIGAFMKTNCTRSWASTARSNLWSILARLEKKRGAE